MKPMSALKYLNYIKVLSPAERTQTGCITECMLSKVRCNLRPSMATITAWSNQINPLSAEWLIHAVCTERGCHLYAQWGYAKAIPSCRARGWAGWGEVTDAKRAKCWRPSCTCRFYQGLTSLGKGQWIAPTAADGISAQHSAGLQLDFWEGGGVTIVRRDGVSKQDPTDPPHVCDCSCTASWDCRRELSFYYIFCFII